MVPCRQLNVVEYTAKNPIFYFLGLCWRTMTNLDILQLAIKKAGGMRALGRALGINYQAIQSWNKIPAERIVDIERVTGVPREQLRPDLYDHMSAATAYDELKSIMRELESRNRELLEQLNKLLIKQQQSKKTTTKKKTTKVD